MPAALRIAALFLVLSQLPAAHAQAPVPGPSGKWKFRFTEENKSKIAVLVMFTEDNGKWVGDYLSATATPPKEPKFTSVKVTGDSIQFNLTIAGRDFLNFEGLLAKDGKKISGSYSLRGGPLRLMELSPSKLRKLDDAFEVAREEFAQMEGGDGLFDAGFTVASMAAQKKLQVEEVRGVADKLARAATSYGPRWERMTAMRLADSFATQEGFSELALAQARRAERMLTDEDTALTQLSVLEQLAALLTKLGKAEDAKKYAATIAKLEARDAADYAKTMMAFEAPAYAGRKAKSDRVVVLEVFTGADSPVFVAVGAAIDGIAKTYKPSDVVFLQYHFDVPGPNPLTNPDSVERLGLYADAIRGAPAIFINGKPGPVGGGPLTAAKGKYTDIREVLDAELEKAATAKLALTITKDDAGYTAKAAVSDLDKPGEKVKLRFILVEDVVRYPASNGLRYYQHVVRAIPGGAAGFPLTKKTHEQSVTIKPADIRDSLNKYLDKSAREDKPYSRPDRPLVLKNLKLIAIIQDDATSEILQAAQVDLEAK